MEQGPRAETPAPGGEHRATTTDQGPFCFARCSCGWRGPARRARSLARADARQHGTAARN